MIKTQVQIPDHLHATAKRIAADYEMSFAEVVRRGLEPVARLYPPRDASGAWRPPEPRSLGCLPLDPAALRDAACGDDPGL